MKIRMLSIVLGTALVLQSSLTAFAAETSDTFITVSGSTLQKSAVPTDIADMEACKKALQQLLANKTVSALIYLCEQYDIKSEPDTDSSTVASVYSGQQVFIKDFASTDGEIWYKISCYLNDQEYVGYVEQDHLAYSDEEFLAWENTFIGTHTAILYNADGRYADVTQFPASYQNALNSLKSAHPNWTFVKFNTNLDWNTVIANEDVVVSGQPRNAVPSNSPASWISGTWTGSWSRASTDIIKYYMDPRNFLSDPYIFQFEQLTYNASYHTQSAVQNILNNSFMAGGIPGDSRSYSQAFYEIGSSLGVSPFHLACRVYQEQGRNGTSALISGTYPGYENLYNYYNIGATGSTDTAVITNGLNRARSEGWTTRYASLSGGAKILSQNYILKGQDTLYLQKFDVDSSYNGLYYHQYMQNIMAPCSESNSIRRAYSNAGALNNNFVFKIPVYNNMPANACPEPGSAPSTIFNDVSASDWFYEAVNYAYTNNIMSGVGNNMFDPYGKTTRATVVQILYNSMGKPAVSDSNRFADVSSGAWYANAVNWAVQNNITAGISATRFAPDQEVSRQEVAVFLYKYAKLKGYNTSGRNDLSSFNDCNQISGWAMEALQWANNAGIINGKGAGNLDPLGSATRAEIAAMMKNFMTKY